MSIRQFTAPDAQVLEAQTRREKRNAQRRAWGRANPQKLKEYATRWRVTGRYRWTVEAFEAQFAVQDGRCVICQKSFDSTKKEPHIDHDHATKSIRGLLCNTCNLGLGHFKDDPHLLRRAAEYLTQTLARAS